MFTESELEDSESDFNPESDDDCSFETKSSKKKQKRNVSKTKTVKNASAKCSKKMEISKTSPSGSTKTQKASPSGISNPTVLLTRTDISDYRDSTSAQNQKTSVIAKTSCEQVVNNPTDSESRTDAGHIVTSSPLIHPPFHPVPVIAAPRVPRVKSGRGMQCL